MEISMKMFLKKESYFRSRAVSIKDVSTIFRFHDPMLPLAHACPLSIDTPSTCMCRYNYLEFWKNWTYNTDPCYTYSHIQTLKHIHMLCLRVFSFNCIIL